MNQNISSPNAEDNPNSNIVENSTDSPEGLLPALYAFQPSGARLLNNTSDKMLRQLLPVHKNRNFIMSYSQ